jgi:hypothetical protein
MSCFFSSNCFVIEYFVQAYDMNCWTYAGISCGLANLTQCDIYPVLFKKIFVIEVRFVQAYEELISHVTSGAIVYLHA